MLHFLHEIKEGGKVSNSGSVGISKLNTSGGVVIRHDYEKSPSGIYRTGLGFILVIGCCKPVGGSQNTRF